MHKITICYSYFFGKLSNLQKKKNKIEKYEDWIRCFMLHSKKKTGHFLTSYTI
jgi:hypothetical protein